MKNREVRDGSDSRLRFAPSQDKPGEIPTRAYLD